MEKITLRRKLFGKTMRGMPFFLLCLFSIGSSQGQLINHVQPHSGTAPSTTISALKHSEAISESNANTIPAVTLPFAMTQWTPQTTQTEKKCIPPYLYEDTLLMGFRGSHWLSGSCTQDYGSFSIIPVVGSLTTKASGYAAPYNHSDEVSTPAYYQVKTGKWTGELTSTLRCGVLRFTVQEDDSLYLLMKPNSDYGEGYVEVNEETGEIWGYNPAHRIYQGWGEPTGFNGWFYMKVDKSFSKSGTFDDGEIYGKKQIANKKDIGAFIGFYLKKGEQVSIYTGTSFTGLNGAKKNLTEEVGNKDFETIRRLSEAQWEKSLSQIKVETDNEKDKKIFYTALYHTMQQPRLFNDIDGAYPAFNGNKKTLKLNTGNYYDDFSMWDIYRAELPLFEILSPNLTNDFVRSVVDKAEQGGWLPIFPCWNSYTAAMIGDHVTAFIASAYNKGIRDYDVRKAYHFMRQNAFETPENIADYQNGLGRRALTSYLQYGYIPMEDSVQDAFHKKEQVSRTLEYAYDDYALSVVAESLGQKPDFQILKRRSLNYQNVFDPTVKMVRGRYANGSWYKPFEADNREPYITEGTPRQYTFYVPQDMAGLSKIMGGTKQLETALDSLFEMNEYWHGNEPGHHIPFLYNFTESPYKTQKIVHTILAEEYNDGPGGLSGNDDAGQMSAWYVFAAMGFYPVDPVSNNYQLTSPLFDRIKISLPGGNKVFEIQTHKATSDDIYIQKIRWNGKTYDKNFITYQMIQSGGKLEIWLTNKPSNWGGKIKNRAKSFGKNK